MQTLKTYKIMSKNNFLPSGHRRHCGLSPFGAPQTLRILALRGTAGIADFLPFVAPQALRIFCPSWHRRHCGFWPFGALQALRTHRLGLPHSKRATIGQAKCTPQECHRFIVTGLFCATTVGLPRPKRETSSRTG